MKKTAAQLRLAWVRDGLIAGVDEAGRGPLAGPVVAAAVILDPRRRLRGVRDSKQIADPAERTVLAKRIRASAIAWSVAWADVEEIDSLNILQATYLAMRRALCGLHVAPEHVQIDGNTCPLLTNLGLHCTFEPIIGGDASHANIGAASILAKTTRDAMMLNLDVVYPGYGFASHKGYATPEHYRALDRHGPTPIHRRSFEPVRLAREAMASAAKVGG
ncbi:MAG TPA: ribonuclease HII [Steroidobacteraceae bacterium]|nr:ribonuclease HII [Steroidobacteraceae bacterium]HKS56623.1 ribonuclease HII [Steroidobacteraceae bacterium]